MQLQKMIEFFENYPVLTAILVAVLSWLAIAWELFGLQEKFLAICTTVVGTAIVVGSFGVAQKNGNLGIAGVAITLVAFLAACAWIWSRWLNKKSD
jgi:hypothetical protein